MATHRSVREYAELIKDEERQARILVVDDDTSNLRLVTQILRRAGFSNIEAVSDATAIADTVRDFCPDVVLLDLHMPGINGIAVIAQISEIAGPGNYLPVLVLTGDSSIESRDAALAAGARDFLIKPYETTEVVLRVHNLIETRLLHVTLQRQNALLSESFHKRTAELEAAKIEILERLARAADFRDESTRAHTVRVGDLAARIARRIGMSDEEVEQLTVAARLHDIGKIGLSDSILVKEGPLGPEEFEAQSKHTIIGAHILSGSSIPTMRMAEQVALTHHEAWDGSGYPNRLEGEEIPLAGRITSVADVFDALTHARPYKEPWTVEAALAEIAKKKGTKFDPAVVDAFMEIVGAYVAEEATLNQSETSPEPQSPYKLHLVGNDPEPERVRVVRNILGGRSRRQVQNE